MARRTLGRMASLVEATLDDAERRTLDRFVASLRARLGDDLDSVWLFGSRARGQERRWDSDVDLLVLTVRGSETDRKIAQESIWKASEEEDSLGTVYSVKVNDRTWLEGRREIESFFIQEVDRDKVVLYGKP